MSIRLQSTRDRLSSKIGAHALHDPEIVCEIVDGVQRCRQRFAALHQVAQVCARVTPAHHAIARWIRRSLVLGILFVLVILSSLARVKQRVTRRPSGQHAIHHVHAHARVLLDLIRIADAHHIPRLVFRKQGQHFADYFECLFARFAHAQTADLQRSRRSPSRSVARLIPAADPDTSRPAQCRTGSGCAHPSQVSNSRPEAPTLWPRWDFSRCARK